MTEICCPSEHAQVIGCAVGQKCAAANLDVLRHLAYSANPCTTESLLSNYPQNVHSNIHVLGRPLDNGFWMVVDMVETVSNWQRTYTEERANFSRTRRAS